MNDEMKRKLISKLKNVDYLLLENLYYYRCLSVSQCWKICYKNAGVDLKTFVKKRVTPFHKLKLITINNTGKTYSLMITDIGIDILSTRKNLNNDFFDTKTKKMRTGTLKASAIQMLPRLMNHQIALNQFVIDFSTIFKKQENYDTKFTYHDEKFMSKYLFVRPDGMISFNNLELFLEMDMGTENKKQLIDKWNNYRLALSNELGRTDTKIIVLFILDCPADKLQTRKNIVRYTIAQTLIDDNFDKFDIYIGTKKELLEAVFHKILPIYFNCYFFDNFVIDRLISQRHGFTSGDGSKLKKVFYSASYAYYIRKINEQNRIKRQDGKIQEYMFDEYLFGPMSILNKIIYQEKNSSMFEMLYHRNINYVILVESIDSIYNDLNVLDLLDVPDVYFTTAERLSTRSFCEALFCFDSQGNYYHFQDFGLTEKITEGAI
ncbi:MAG: replication-relaxation family protein [Erysipelotrichaceae bacterium]